MLLVFWCKEPIDLQHTPSKSRGINPRGIISQCISRPDPGQGSGACFGLGGLLVLWCIEPIDLQPPPSKIPIVTYPITMGKNQLKNKRYVKRLKHQNIELSLRSQTAERDESSRGRMLSRQQRASFFWQQSNAAHFPTLFFAPFFWQQSNALSAHIAYALNKKNANKIKKSELEEIRTPGEGASACYTTRTNNREFKKYIKYIFFVLPVDFYVRGTYNTLR